MFILIYGLGHYENMPTQMYWKFYHEKLKEKSDKKSDIFYISAQNIDCWYSLELPCRGGSNEFPQSVISPVTPVLLYKSGV